MRRPMWILNCWYHGVMLWSIDRLPWFARKRLFNALYELNFHDFMISDTASRGQVLLGAAIKW